MVFKEGGLTVQYIAKSIGIGFVSVHTVLAEILGMSKMSAN